MILCTTAAFAMPDYMAEERIYEESSTYYREFLNKMETNANFRQVINAAEELGVTFVDIQESGFSEKEMNNLISFDTAEELLAFIESIQSQNNFVISESELIADTEFGANTMSTSNTTVSKWTYNAISGGAFVWQNISLQYTLTYISGQKHLSNVSITDSFYTGIAIALSRTHQYGSFSGVALITPVAITTPWGTANATGLDLYGVDIFGVPIGLQIQSTFNIEFRP